MANRSLSVVVPIYDAHDRLASCLDSLVAQTHEDLEVVLVDDGSIDGSCEIAERYAERHPGFRLVTREHRGVAAARDAGTARATGCYLTFCDADDEVPPNAYARLVAALEKSGSDVAVGSAAVEVRGRFREPDWARHSNSRRRLRATLADTPQIMANLMPGTHVFRRAAWDAARCSFTESGDRGDVVPIVQALLAARSFDVLPAVVYRWTSRADGRSLLQADLCEPDQARARLARTTAARDLLTGRVPETAVRHFLAQALTAAADLVRAAVNQDEAFWTAVSAELRLLVGGADQESLAYVPVADRITTWLCAHDERHAVEEHLDRAAENSAGLPFRVQDGIPHVIVSTADALPAGSPLTRVAESERRLRTRLSELGWRAPGVLRLEGVALVEYTTGVDQQTHLVLRERNSGAEVSVPTAPRSGDEANRWAGRMFEDHSGAAFEAEIDVASLLRTSSGGGTFDVQVRVEADGLLRTEPFRSRRVGGSAGLLESSAGPDVVGSLKWSEGLGLSVVVRPVLDDNRQDLAPPGPPPTPRPAVVVADIAANGDELVLTGVAATGSELALAGSHSRTPWIPVARDRRGKFTARVPLLFEEWGFGLTTLPRDQYSVLARHSDGAQADVGVALALRRALEPVVDSGTLLIAPSAVGGNGSLTLRLSPGEERDSRPAYLRQQLRDRVYPAACEQPLLPAALFEAFAGKSGGDNPGAVCEELARRANGLDLAVSVVDRSVRVPPGARQVVRWSREWFELLGRAQYVVTNAVLPGFVRDRPGQVVLQTWHGSPFKRIGHDRVDVRFANWRHRRQLVSATRSWDLLLSQSPFGTETLRGAFGYDGRVLEVGYPRNDVLVSPTAEDVRRRTRRRLGIGSSTRVVLYAPTWRDNLRTGRIFDKVGYLDAKRVVERLGDAFVLLRGHHNTMGADEEHTDARIVDVTRFPDISELYLAADALVTDYSSAFFDFALTDKPMCFLAPDLVHYREDGRGFYLDYHDTVPGPVCADTDEVVEVLQSAGEYAGIRREFRDRFAPWDDGQASRRVVDALLAGTPVQDENVVG